MMLQGGRSQVQQHAGRVFQQFLDRVEEGDGTLAVNDPVVIGQCEIHDRPDDDLPVLDDMARPCAHRSQAAEPGPP